MLPRRFFIFAAIALTIGHAEDWPMWRFDAGRTAASSEQLPPELHLQWERKYAAREQVWDDPLNHDLMPYDKIFEPVVLGSRVFIGFNDMDKVVALDLDTGKELWTFFAAGPVRMPPVAWKDKVYVTSDDGFLHCLSAADGKALWSFRGGPSDRKALGNGRLVSAWPARGGPVIRDGRIYFAASIWPFMGTFLYALDAETGKVAWVNDGTGAQFIKQPHSASSFAGVAPQGALVATEKMLLVPGGRSVPAAFDRKTGGLLYFNLNDGGKGNGGSFVAASEEYFYVHTRLRGVRTYDLLTGKAAKSTCNEPVIVGNRLYSAAESENGVAVVRELGTSEEVHWEIEADGSGDLIKAGNQLYAAGKNGITAISLPHGTSKPSLKWTLPVRGEILRLLAANGKLIAVTADGRILAFGGKKMSKTKPIVTTPVDLQPDAAAVERARALLRLVQNPQAFILCHGTDDWKLIEALVHESSMQFVIVEPDADHVETLRRRLDAAGLHGTRASVHHATPATFKPPQYFAQLVVISPATAAVLKDEAVLRHVYQAVRPYGGVLALPQIDQQFADHVRNAGIEQATLRPTEHGLLVVREGALPGAADWTHQYGDIGNTVKSDDRLVRAPLGILWFGGNSNLDVLPRHGHGPPEQIVGGRLFIQGMNSISARDVYTGSVLWKHAFDDLGTFGIYYNETYADTPLSTAYNQKHIPGANGRGSNYVATADTVYLAVHGECHALDARTGSLRQKIPLRLKRDEAQPADWGFIGVLDDVLLGGDGFAHYSLKLGGAASTKTASIEDYSASDGLAAFDRHSGRELWRVKARHSFLHNGIVAGNGRIYCLDKLTTYAEGLLDRRGTPLPTDYRIVALDARTGAVLWEQQANIFGTWLGYSKQNDILLQAGAKASDRLPSEVGDGMIAYRGGDGGILWQDLKSKYTGPCILHNDLVFTGANSYANSNGVINLKDGTPHLVPNPLTGKMEPWRINRTYGCNTVVASENLLTYRSGAAGFYDLETKSGTANLGGFKSGCTSNLVVANGVLNAPDYTRTCSCAYQNQTSLGLVHMPEIELWAYSQFGLDGEEGERIQRVGINFGAPGDRRAPDGTLWLEHPETDGGISPGLEIEIKGDKIDWFRRHSSQVAGDDLLWVGASGLTGEAEIVIRPSLRKGELKKPPSSKKKDEDEDEGGGGKAKPASTPGVAEVKPAAEQVAKISHPPAPYTVRLHFAEPDGVADGGRVFTVAIQGKAALENFDIAQAAGATARTHVREFPSVLIGDTLTIRLTSARGSTAPPVLCGVELLAEKRTAGTP
ncbi:MAG: PQQ-binding-like beta-propeller repeat protein [Chthoniobacteraceae bacterium]